MPWESRERTSAWCTLEAELLADTPAAQGRMLEIDECSSWELSTSACARHTVSVHSKHERPLFASTRTIRFYASTSSRPDSVSKGWLPRGKKLRKGVPKAQKVKTSNMPSVLFPTSSLFHCVHSGTVCTLWPRSSAALVYLCTCQDSGAATAAHRLHLARCVHGVINGRRSFRSPIDCFFSLHGIPCGKSA